MVTIYASSNTIFDVKQWKSALVYMLACTSRTWRLGSGSSSRVYNSKKKIHLLQSIYCDHWSILLGTGCTCTGKKSKVNSDPVYNWTLRLSLFRKKTLATFSSPKYSAGNVKETKMAFWNLFKWLAHSVGLEKSPHEVVFCHNFHDFFQRFMIL